MWFYGLFCYCCLFYDDSSCWISCDHSRRRHCFNLRIPNDRWLFVNAQLWSSAFLLQAVRACIPFGWIWTPVLDDLVTVVNFLESATLNRVAYFNVTTGALSVPSWNKTTTRMLARVFIRCAWRVLVLGGRLAIIWGAQTCANAVTISGLNGVKTLVKTLKCWLQHEAHRACRRGCWACHV